MTSKRKSRIVTNEAEASFSDNAAFPVHRSLRTAHSDPPANHQSPVTNRCLIVELGLIPYADAYGLQQRVVAARKAGLIPDVLLLCEHPHVITQGRSGKRQHLLAGEHVLRQKGIEYFETHRGGDITYHGPGQIVGYPIVNLAAIRRDVVWYVRMLEEAMIRATRAFRIEAVREPGKTGIWVAPPSQQPGSASPANSHRPLASAEKRGISSEIRRACPEEEGVSSDIRRVASEKLGAIGVHISRWVTSHGFAYNVSTDLRYFDLIIPCGISDRKATSLEKLLQRQVALSEVNPLLARELCAVFDREPVTHSAPELYNLLRDAESSSDNSLAREGFSPHEQEALRGRGLASEESLLTRDRGK